jgi:glycerol-3-phosphate dehydrogenase
MSPRTVYDLAIIGGGINGCGIARDAAGRGARVVLFEQNDLGSGTSSASTKLIHGGLRYLEHYEFRLVRESLRERETLWRIAPHVIWPLRFVLPHHKGLRPAWLLRLGLFLYDHLGTRKRLAGTRTVDFRQDATGTPLKPDFRIGFEYSDCWVEDSRLVVLNASAARAMGADIHTRTRVTSARRVESLWQITTQGREGERHFAARVLVNVAGPWVGEALGHIAGTNAPAKVRLVKGSHIVTRRLYAHDRAYIFQNADGRIVFAIPYETDFTLIGTTDQDYRGDPAAVAIADDEIAYLTAAVSDYLKKPVSPADVVWSYSGVRPLYDDGASAAQEATRDYVLHLDAPDRDAPLLSVFGGKLTTYRRLAEAALAELQPWLPSARPVGWTGTEPLPGGDFPMEGYAALVETLADAYPALPRPLLARLARAYGTRTRELLGNARTLQDLGPLFGADLSAREVDYLRREEWAKTAEDILWRRSKLGLRVTKDEIATLEGYLAKA